MAAQGLARDNLRCAVVVAPGGVEVVHPVLDGIVDELVDLFLVVGQSHHAEA